MVRKDKNENQNNINIPLLYKLVCRIKVTSAKIPTDLYFRIQKFMWKRVKLVYIFMKKNRIGLFTMGEYHYLIKPKVR